MRWAGYVVRKGETINKYIHTYLITYLLTYSLTECNRVLLEKLTGLQPVRKFPAFHGTRRFITALTCFRHLSLSWARSIQSIPPTSHFLKIHFNIILQSTPRSPRWSQSLRFPHQNPVYASPLPHTCHMPRPSHSRFDHLNNINIYKYQYKSIHFHNLKIRSKEANL